MNVVLHCSFDLLKSKFADVASQLGQTMTGDIQWGWELYQTIAHKACPLPTLPKANFSMTWSFSLITGTRLSHGMQVGAWGEIAENTASREVWKTWQSKNGSLGAKPEPPTASHKKAD